ncbi:copper chaperone PCu(A)C [Sanguibacter antarcticus]|uniref:Copper(I)-binding protein n=1 Tax=Sanguibacter antarcticus TaxID=372484 RepID=A0A2A9E7W1_9MICO|nr:copper chaperone PCu(A)C [Sanguibacter antarcticus]PFG34923.1 hypothetical protein ATL42_2854 [Sanguibacter antarcticus]
MSARLTKPTVALATVALLALAGCSSSDTTTESPAASSDAPAATTASTAAESVTIENAWVKAADEGMSAAFGDLKNSGTEDVTVTSATTAASSMVELHETVENEDGEMAMRAKDGGFTIPAGGDLMLAPGGNHIMLMDLVDPVTAGDEITFTLTFSDDSTVEFTAPAKDYSGANENYEGADDEMSDMGDMTDATPSETDMNE